MSIFIKSNTKISVVRHEKQWNENTNTYFQHILLNLLEFKNEAKLKYAKGVDEPDTEHEAEFPELNDEEGNGEAIGVEQHQLENGGEGHERDLELQNTQTEGLHVGGSLQFYWFIGLSARSNRIYYK